MTRRAVRVAGLALGLVVGCAAHAPAQTTEAPATARPTATASTFRSGTELAALQVAVVDAHRRYVADLGVDDFGVFEEGVRQDVTLFAAATAPLDVMLLLDTSSSMFQRMEIAQEAALNFVRTLREGDRAAVVLFSQSVRVVQRLTEDAAAVEDAIRAASPSGGTALHEALYIALRELVRVRRGDGELRRQALIVLTDGDDNSSHVSFEDALAEARRSAVTVYTVFPPTTQPAFEIASRKRSVATFDMRTLAEQTGGRAFAPARIEDLSDAYREIADELSQQYWLAFVPTASASGGFRRVSVRIETRPGLRARSRSGYYASEQPYRASAPSERRERGQP